MVVVRAFDLAVTSPIAIEAKTDTAGIFSIEVPRAGRYRLAFEVFPNQKVAGDTVAVGVSGFVQRRYLLSVQREPVFLELQVDKQPEPKPGNPQPLYPPTLRVRQTEGEVMVRFIISKAGRVEPKSIEIVRSTHPLFSTAVRMALLKMEFTPGEYRGQPVRVAVSQPFHFLLTP